MTAPALKPSRPWKGVQVAPAPLDATAELRRGQSVRPGSIPRGPFADLIDRLVEEVDDPDAGGRGGGGQSELAARIAAATGSTVDRWQRRLYTIRTGKTVNRRGDKYEQEWISFETADAILTGLEMTHLWTTELADCLVLGERRRPHATFDPDAPTACPTCLRVRDPLFEPGGLEGECVLCRAAKTTKLKRGRLSFEVRLRLYERYVVEGLTVAELCEAECEELGYKSALGLESWLSQLWGAAGWPRRQRNQARRLRAKLRPTMPKTLREHGGEKTVRILHLLHERRGQSIRQMSIQLGEEWGVPYKRLTTEISTAFSKLGLPARDRIEATRLASTKHGYAPRDHRERSRRRRIAHRTVHGNVPKQARCAAMAGRGRCRHRSMKDSEFCFSHDPRHIETNAARLADMRTRSPVHDPERLESADRLAGELQEAKAAGWTWRGLSEKSGVPEHYISWVAAGRQEHVSKERAAAIREAIVLRGARVHPGPRVGSLSVVAPPTGASSPASPQP